MPGNPSAFNELRPLCIDLSRLSFQPRETFNPESVPLRDALAKLEAKLASYDDVSFQPNLADYIFVPISSLLKQESLGDTQSSYVLLIISHLLRLSWRKNGTFAKELAQQLLPLITYLISRDPSNGKLDLISQECKRAGCCALFEYAKSLCQQSYGREFFASEGSKNLTALAHSISTLLTILEQSSKDWQTQVKILDTILVFYCDILGDGELLSFILPGNISTFTKILTLPGLTTNFQVAIKTLDVMKHLILLVYDDLSLNIRDNRITDVKQLSIDSSQGDALDFNTVLIETPVTDGRNVHRSTAWLKATSSQIRLALERIIPKLQKRKNIAISRALADLASDLLSRCSKSLNNCERSLIEILIHCKMDPKFQLQPHIICLKGLLSDELSEINTMVQFQDVDALTSLNYGLLSFTDVSTTYDSLLVNQLCTSALKSIEAVIESASFTNLERPVLEQHSDIVMAESFAEELINTKSLPTAFPSLAKDVELSISELFRTAGRLASKHGQLKSVVQTMLSDQVDRGAVNKTIALWLSSQMVLSLGQDHYSSEELLLNLDFDEGEKETCYDILEFGNDLAQEIVASSEGKTLSKLSEITLAVIINSIETACRILRNDFSSELVDYLYIIIENLASPSPKVRHYAQSCSLTVAHTLYNNSVQDMILQNTDYLVDSISSRLNCGLTERVSTVFMVICKLAGYETIESFKDIIETFFKFLDYYHGYDNMCIEFFHLFEVIVLEIKKQYFIGHSSDHRITYHSDKHRIGSPWGMSNVQQVIAIMDKQSTLENDDGLSLPEKDPRSFQEYFDSKLRVTDSDDEDSDEEAEEEPADPEGIDRSSEKEENKWVSPIPRGSYRVLLQILGYGDRLLTHRSKPLRVQILRVLKLMTPMLASQYNSFLPQVAQVWDTLVLCSLDDDLSIVKPACDCLQELIQNAGDFITTRFLELWKTWQQRSAVLRELKISETHAKSANKPVVLHRKFPTITYMALVSMTQVLMEGLMVAGLTVPDLTSREMLYCCIQVHPWESVAAKSLAISDTISAIIQDTE